ncbi:MAG TPA: histidine kinase [Myxococcales bacterium]|jgi:two-component system sensor histidine kinase AlgZ
MEGDSRLKASLTATLHREALICLAVGAPSLGLVLATNHTASVPLILLHAALLVGLVPVSVAYFDLALPRPERLGWRSMLRDLGIRVLGLGFAVIAMLLLIATLTPLTLEVLVGGPLLVGLVPVFLAYALAALAVQWARLREEALRAEAGEIRARQAALAARIRPHFLFNALNCIEELTDTDPPAARLATGRLARLLRSVLQSSASPKGRLEDEVRLVDDYLGLEKVRFGERLSYELDVAPDAAGLELPATVLLTLAENAVKHGCEAVPGAARIVLRAKVADGALRVTVTSPAASTPAPAPTRAEPGTGYGLADVRERLLLAYGPGATCVLTTQGGESRVELVLPR